MPVFHSTQSFRGKLKSLCAKPKDGYSSITKDVCKSFANKHIDEIRINKDVVLNEDSFTVIKLRMPNSGQKLSKSNGFRLIYLVHKVREEVVFLTVYPKRGSLGLITVKEKEILSLLAGYIKEKKEKSLVLHDIENNLKE